jgi:hypothetical protein
MRFVRGVLDSEYQGPSYAQNDWVSIHGYAEMNWDFLVTLWFHYNLLLAVLFERIPSEKFATPCTIGSYEPAALDFVIEDYIRHLQHHVDHILARATITPYP